MANGDAAAAAGMDVVAGTADLRLSYDEINKTRDYLAGHETSGTHPASAIVSGILPIVRGGTGGATAADARTALGVDPPLGFTPVQQGGGAGQGSNKVKIGWSAGGLKLEVDGIDFGVLRLYTDGQFAGNPIYSPHGRSNGVSGGLTAYLGADGRLAVAPSSRRFKKDIKAWAPDQQAVLAMQVVSYHYKVDIDPDGTDQVGLIAEDLDNLGLTWLVAYDEEGAPFAVHYDRLALALLPIVQDLNQRVTKLEEAARA